MNDCYLWEEHSWQELNTAQSHIVNKLAEPNPQLYILDFFYDVMLPFFI